MTNWRPMKTQYNVNGPLFPKQKSTIKSSSSDSKDINVIWQTYYLKNVIIVIVFV